MDLFYWIRNNLCAIITGAISCILLGSVIALVPSLITLYLPDRSVEIIKSKDTATDAWAIRYITNLTSLHLIVTRAASPYDKSGLGASFDRSMGTPSGTTQVQGASLNKQSSPSFQRSRRQDTTEGSDTPSTVYFDVVLQELYPHQCFGVVRCQKLFRKQVLSKFSSRQKFSFAAPLLNGRSIGLELQLESLTENYVITVPDDTSSIGTSNSPLVTTAPIITTLQTIITTLQTITTTAASVTTTTPLITTTTTTTTTTTSTTTTTTARPVVCPSAVWDPNGLADAGSIAGTVGATTALLNGPYAITMDSAFNLYVADFWNYRVMQWPQGSTNGIKVGPQLGIGGTADMQHINTATAFSFDLTESNLYISDTFNCRILQWNIASNTLTTIIGTTCGIGLNQFNWCDGLCIDRFGNIYLSDYLNDRVLKFPPNVTPSANGVLVAGTGVAGPALNQLDTPRNVCIDGADNDALYVVDSVNHRVMKWPVNAVSGIVVAGGNGAGALYTQLVNPQGLFVDSFGTSYVTDFGNNRVMKWLKNATNGTFVIGTAGAAGIPPTVMSGPSGVLFDKNGDMHVSEYLGHRVRRFVVNNTSC